jgi:hypothetical protein
VGNKENGYPVPFNKTKINYAKEPSESVLLSKKRIFFSQRKNSVSNH